MGDYNIYDYHLGAIFSEKNIHARALKVDGICYYLIFDVLFNIIDLCFMTYINFFFIFQIGNWINQL